jgi:hypothetical protein
VDCANLFSFNLFEFLDKVKLPDISELESELSTDELLDYLSEESESDSFNEALAEDPDTRNDIDAYLDDVGTNGTDDQRQKALALKGDLSIYTSPAGDFVNNVAGVVMDPNFDFQAAPLDSLTNFIRSAVPPEALVSQAAFNDMLDRFVAADGAYDRLGDELLVHPPAEDVNWGSTAQNALVAYVIANAVKLPVDGGQGVDRSELYKLAKNEPNTVTFSDPFDVAYNHDHVDEIVDAAGLGGVITW